MLFTISGGACYHTCYNQMTAELFATQRSTMSPFDVNHVPWERFPQPEWNRPDTVPQALQLLASVDDQIQARRVYDTVLYALGNNHAGTVYPVALPALLFIRNVAASSQVWACHTAFDILIDLCAFEPEPGYETIIQPDQSQVRLADALRHEIAQARVLAEQVRDGVSTPSALQSIVQEFLEVLDDLSIR
jgi:hypothetical protein